MSGARHVASSYSSPPSSGQVNTLQHGELAHALLPSWCALLPCSVCRRVAVGCLCSPRLAASSCAAFGASVR